jgi:hypothetical protein
MRRHPPQKGDLQMNNLTTLLQELLSEHGYQCLSHNQRDDTLRSQVRLQSGHFGLVIDTGTDPDELSIYLYFPEKVPEVKRYTVMEFLTRINLHIPMGHFEIDLEDGRVRFVVSQLLELTLTLMRRALDRVETFFPGILRIVHGNLHAVAALTEIEQKHGYACRHAGTYPSQCLN